MGGSKNNPFGFPIITCTENLECAVYTPVDVLQEKLADLKKRVVGSKGTARCLPRAVRGDPSSYLDH